MIAEHAVRAAGVDERANHFEHAEARGSAIDQIADQPELELAAERAPRAREEIAELVGAALYVAYEDALHIGNVVATRTTG